MMTQRISKFKEFVHKKDSEYLRQADPEEIANFVSLETNSLLEEAKDLRNLPPVYRKAMAYKKLFSTVPPRINAYELLIGVPMRECFPSYLFEDEHLLFANPSGVETPTNVVPNYHKILMRGFQDIKKEAEDRLGQLRKLKNPEIIWFLKAVILCCEAISDLAYRYSTRAEQMAEEEEDSNRKEELSWLSSACKRVPAYPARCFHEAVQALWFTHMALRADDSFHIPIGRLDCVLYPFYERDRARGLITQKEAQELLDCLWVKFNSIHSLRHYFEGDNGQAVVVGGQTRTGEDATNDLSYMMIESSMRLEMIQPSLKVRIHKKTPPKLIKKACQLARMGTGSPLFCNDDIIVPSLVKAGYALEDARDYVTSACAEILIPGKSNNRPNWGEVCFLRCLESTLNNGESLLTKEKMGSNLGKLSDHGSFNNLMDSLKKQITFAVENEVSKCEGKKYAPAPFLSATMADCIWNARDVSEGGAYYNNIGMWGSALANTADALAALKKLVFTEKKISAEELHHALKENYGNNESLRLMLINKAPKFGCDEDYVDVLAKEVAVHFAREVLKYSTQESGRYLPSLVSAWSYVFVGKELGASPDGRKAREPFAVNFSPAPGADRKGPTAVIRSLTKIDLTDFPNGSPTDMKFSPSVLSGDSNLGKLVSFIKTFMELGGSKIQFNVVDSATLKKAQMEPENYQNLAVRVWGFSAYFVTLTKDFQNHIIERYEHCDI